MTRAEDDDTLSLYLRDLGDLPVQQPGDEIAFAERLRAAELELWSVLLSGPGAAAVADLEIKTPAAICDADRDRSRRDAAIKLARTSTSAQHKRRVERLAAEVYNARNDFALANSRLVLAIVKQYGRRRGPGYADLVQEGNLGLLRAVDRFNPTLGFRFSSYACWWIRAAITRAIGREGDVYLTPALRTAHRKVAAAYEELSQELGDIPSQAAVRQRAGVSEEQFLAVNRWIQRRMVSLDEPTAGAGSAGPAGAGRPVTYHDVVADEDESSEVDAALEAEADEKILAVLPDIIDELSDVEADVIRRRYREEPEPLWKIGNDYGLSRERIRQIQEGALVKLRRALEKRRMI